MNIYDCIRTQNKKGSLIIGKAGATRAPKRIKGELYLEQATGKLYFLHNEFTYAGNTVNPKLPGYLYSWGLIPPRSDYDKDSFEPETELEYLLLQVIEVAEQLEQLLKSNKIKIL